MKTVILNGAATADDPVDALSLLIEQHCRAAGESAPHFILREHSIGHCLGDFDCWVRTPGRCRLADEGQEIERAVHDADVVVLTTPLLFGGEGPELKKAIDRLIPLILPFFTRAEGLTHHAHRYERLPALIGLAIGKTEPDNHALFSALVESQALNLGAPRWRAEVLSPEQAATMDCFHLLRASEPPRNPSGDATAARAMLLDLVAATPLAAPFGSKPRVVLLVGSARPPGASTSLSIARYLADQLAVCGADPEIVMATEIARGGQVATAAAARLAAADVLAVVAPLYVDALPYLATLALRETAEARLRMARPAPQRLIAIINCGFPEPEHTRFAFASLRAFARATGAHFAGGLSLGGGEAIHGQPLADAGGVARSFRDALDKAARALAAGQGIPVNVSHAVARPLMPPALYRFAGGMGWRFRSLSRGVWPTHLTARPFDALSDADWQSDSKQGGVRGRPLRVVGKRQETTDCVTILFEDPAHDRVSYRAGQYITLDVPFGEERIRRSYSLASTPDEPGLAIAVKRVPGGRMSNHLHDDLHVGDIVRSHGPSGSFMPHPADHKLLLVGGGSGVVPLVAIARFLLRHAPQARIVFVYGASDRGNAIYTEALEALADRFAAHFSLFWVIEREDVLAAGHGRLDEAGAGNLLTSLEPARFDRIMLCGPDAMRASMRTMLAARGIDRGRILEESFASPRAGKGSDAPETLRLVLDDGTEQAIEARPGQSVLDALLDAGAAIDFSCLSGGCGACTITLLDGAYAVALDEPNSVTAADRHRGRVPACISRPVGTVRLRVDAR